VPARPLDALLPEAGLSMVHRTHVAAPPEAVWAALHAVTGGELLLTSALVGLRALPGRLTGGREPLSVAAHEPVLARFLQRGFVVLDEDAPRSLAAGAAGRPWDVRGADTTRVADRAGFLRFAEPGHVRMALSFELIPDDGGTELETETRVQPTDAGAARAFARYWRVIRVGSALIRHDLLRAVRRRAERG
jgi:hypothetical protein